MRYLEITISPTVAAGRRQTRCLAARMGRGHYGAQVCSEEMGEKKWSHSGAVERGDLAVVRNGLM